MTRVDRRAAGVTLSRKGAKNQTQSRKSRSTGTKTSTPGRRPGADLEQQLEKYRHELAEALEQQTATGEVLRIISTSPTELQPVLDVVVKNAARFCGADDVTIFQCDRNELRATAHWGPLPQEIGLRMPRSRGSVGGRAVVDGKAVHVLDLQAETEEFPEGSTFAKRLGHRTTLSVPMLREGMAIGTIQLRRAEVRPFNDKQIALLKTFAAQAVIAIENTRLLKELRQRTGDLSEALEQQTATSEVLKVISSSPGELEPVFQTMLENATRICEANFGTLFRFEGDTYRVVASHNAPPPLAASYREGGLRRPTPGTLFERMVRTKQVCRTADYAAESVPGNAARLGGARSFVCVPMLKDDALIGALSIYRQEVRPFTEKQIALLTTFADQAVIAIENTRLLNELRESLQQQTATADVLKVISRSAFDLQTVLDTLTESAAHLCEADMAAIARQKGDAYYLVSVYGYPPDVIEYVKTIPHERGRGSVVGRTVLAAKTVHVTDVLADPEYTNLDMQQKLGLRTVLGAPLLREGNPIGVISLVRNSVRSFTDKQIELVTTFADQAVIAIENVRLFDEVQARTSELSEALEQQTATSEVLRVISSSPGQLEPVFQAMLEKAVRVCEAKFGILVLVEGYNLRRVGIHGASPEFLEEHRLNPIIPVAQTPVGRVIETKSAMEVADLAAEYGNTPIVKLAGARTMLVVPMLKENTVIGAVGIYRQEVQPFSDKQITLLTNFAAQAVIAIENTRLLNELRESLAQQTATSEVLQVISSSPGELQPVFQAMLTNATRICEAKFGNLFLYEPHAFRHVCAIGEQSAFLEWMRRQPTFALSDHPHVPLAKLARTKEVIHIVDLKAERGYIERDPRVLAMVESASIRTMLLVPMLNEDELIGAIVIYRQEVRPFTDKQIELVKNFAAQAVIAIENTRLLNELRESLQQQTATADVLKVISRSTFDLPTVLKTLVESAAQLCEADKAQILRPTGEDASYYSAAYYGHTPEYLEHMRAQTWAPGRGTAVGRAMLERKSVQIPDVLADSEYTAQEAARLGGFRTILVVPLLREGVPIGRLAMHRAAVRSFSEKQIELAETFADQAVIAIENVRLFEAEQQRTLELSEALDQVKATSEVLHVVSSSPNDLASA